MNPHLSSTRDIILSLESSMNSVIIGQNDLIRKLITSLFAWGHVLIEWVPWLGKTKTVKTLAHVLGYDFKRISFTPDLLPSDLSGSEIFRPQTGKFEVRKWPIFTHILLADEINRTPPKVQSALLEAMEEGQVTIGENSLPLPSPFFVIATENPLEHEGTYPLPEAQLDRFLMKILLDYPAPLDEKKIFALQTPIWREEEPGAKGGSSSDEIISSTEFLEIQKYIETNIRVDEKIYDYISDILEMTRKRSVKNWQWKTDNERKNPNKTINSPLSIGHWIEYGASTRAWLALIRCARVWALLEGRDFVLPEDIKSLTHEILRHRIGLSYEAISEGITTDFIIHEILETVRVP